MKTFLYCCGVVILMSSFNLTDKALNSNEYEIKEFYEGIVPDDGVKVVTNFGNLEEIALILVPTYLEQGNYQVEITRKASNLYKIEGTDYFIETRFCYELAIRKDVILKVESNIGYSKGEVIFD